MFSFTSCRVLRGKIPRLAEHGFRSVAQCTFTAPIQWPQGDSGTPLRSERFASMSPRAIDRRVVPPPLLLALLSCRSASFDGVSCCSMHSACAQSMRDHATAGNLIRWASRPSKSNIFAGSLSSLSPVNSRRWRHARGSPDEVFRLYLPGPAAAGALLTRGRSRGHTACPVYAGRRTVGPSCARTAAQGGRAFTRPPRFAAAAD